MKHFSKSRIAIIATCGIVAATLSAHAQEIIDPSHKNSPGALSAEVTGGMSETDYGLSIERSFIGGSVAYGFDERIDLLAAGAVFPSSELKSPDTDGDGFAVSFGARGTIYEEDKFTLFAYSVLRYSSETFEGDESETWDYTNYYTIQQSLNVSYEITLETIELFVGGGISYAVNDALSLYCCAAIIPLSDMTTSTDISTDYGINGTSVGTTANSYSVEFDRAQAYVGRGGCVYSFGTDNNMWVRGELSIQGEETLLIAAGMEL